MMPQRRAPGGIARWRTITTTITTTANSARWTRGVRALPRTGARGARGRSDRPGRARRADRQPTRPRSPARGTARASPPARGAARGAPRLVSLRLMRRRRSRRSATGLSRASTWSRFRARSAAAQHGRLHRLCSCCPHPWPDARPADLDLASRARHQLARARGEGRPRGVLAELRLAVTLPGTTTAIRARDSTAEVTLPRHPAA